MHFTVPSYYHMDNPDKHRQQTRKVSPQHQSWNQNVKGTSDDPLKFDKSCIGTNMHEFQRVDQSDIFVISAFLENRNFTQQHFVKILGLVPKGFKDTIMCTFKGDRPKTQNDTFRPHAKVRLFPEYQPPFCRWKPAFIKCPIPDQNFKPKMVSLHILELGNITNVLNVTNWRNTANVLKVNSLQGNATKTLGTCSDTMYNYRDKDIGPFIEFVEMNIKLGVDTIFIYGAHNVSANVMKVIQYYVTQGAVILVPWKVPMHVEYEDTFHGEVRRSNIPGVKKYGKLPYCVKKHAQRLAYLDCLYSNMAKYSFLAFLDRDEVIVPHAHDTLPQMLKHLQSTLEPNIAALTSHEHHFCTEKINIIGGKTIQKFVTKIRKKASGRAVKSIVQPMDVITMQIHRPEILVPGKSMIMLPRNTSTSNHFRNNHRCYNDTKTVQDFSIMIFKDYLLQRIENITTQMNVFH